MIVVFNFGSSSFKFKFFSIETNKSIIEGICEKIGDKTGIASFKFFEENNVRNIKLNIAFEDHKSAFLCVKEILLNDKNALLKGEGTIKAVGHRVVHGGSFFSSSTIIDSYVLEKIQKLVSLAPVHNKANINGILNSMEFLGEKIPQIAVFDTSFFTTLKKEVYSYAFPRNLTKKYGIRKYGFHGISHQYAFNRYSEFKNTKKLKVVTCHLGSGSSICAIENGIAIDTSMGISPLGGIMMGSRCGSCDPSIIINLMKNENLTHDEAIEFFNTKTGILGVSQISSDLRDVICKYSIDKCAKLSIDMYCYKIIKYIGSYITILGGCDCIIFTAGIGENLPKIRKMICDGLSFFRIKLSEEKNNSTISKENLISEKDSEIDIYVVPADEEKCIFEETKKNIRIKKEVS